MKLRSFIGKAGVLCLFFLFSIFYATIAEHGNYQFYFGDGTTTGFLKVSEQTLYDGLHSPYGYDLGGVPAGNDPFFFSVDLPEGNYKVTVTLGDRERPTNTTA